MTTTTTIGKERQKRDSRTDEAAVVYETNYSRPLIEVDCGGGGAAKCRE